MSAGCINRQLIATIVITLKRYVNIVFTACFLWAKTVIDGSTFADSCFSVPSFFFQTKLLLLLLISLWEMFCHWEGSDMFRKAKALLYWLKVQSAWWDISNWVIYVLSWNNWVIITEQFLNMVYNYRDSNSEHSWV